MEALWLFCCVIPDFSDPDPNPTAGCGRLMLWTGLMTRGNPGLHGTPLLPQHDSPVVLFSSWASSRHCLRSVSIICRYSHSCCGLAARLP